MKGGGEDGWGGGNVLFWIDGVEFKVLRTPLDMVFNLINTMRYSLYHLL